MLYTAETRKNKPQETKREHKQTSNIHFQTN